jgi:hypothetical protein
LPSRLLAILAAGETPSPELVAAAGAQSGLRTGTAVTCLIALFLGLIAVLALNRKSGLIERAHPGTPPLVLAARAREILEKELAAEQELLARARQELVEQEATRSGDERNYARVLERLQPYKDNVDLHEKNVEALRRELGNSSR